MRYWLKEVDGRYFVRLTGSLDIKSARVFTRLDSRLNVPAVAFDLEGINYINSDGGNAWTSFLASFPAGREIVLIRCSPTFVEFLNLLPEFCGAAVVESLFVPCRCSTCGRRGGELFLVEKILDSQEFPKRKCSCSGDMQSIASTGRYLGFLHRGEEL